MSILSDPLLLVTTGRADYGLLCPLIDALRDDGGFAVRLAVTGGHLAASRGETVRLIAEEGRAPLAGTVDLALQGDTADDICRAVATGLAGFSRLYERVRPAMIIVLGDRYELWAACIPAVIHRIPIAHIHGGETTFGAIDDAIRHSITKMAALHFASTASYARRLVQMGEDPRRVFVVGALGLDVIRTVDLLSPHELAVRTGVDFSRPVALMTFHPVTLDDYEAAGRQARAVLEALRRTDLHVLASMPNTDPAAERVRAEIERYCAMYPERFVLVANLGSQAYLSAMRYATLMVGNSSSGIIEAASFALPVVNVGDRQAGRIRPANVIDCPCDEKAVSAALAKARSPEFRRSLAGRTSPYGDGRAAQRIVEVLHQRVPWRQPDLLLKKGFYDLPMTGIAFGEEAAGG